MNDEPSMDRSRAARAATPAAPDDDTVARRWVVIAAGTSLLAVAAGAFGAHALRGRLDAQQLATFQTAVQYQFIHGAAILGCAALRPKLAVRPLSVAVGCFVAGTILFCGSLYALALSGIRALGMITPIGGVAFLAGWLALSMAARRPIASGGMATSGSPVASARQPDGTGRHASDDSRSSRNP